MTYSGNIIGILLNFLIGVTRNPSVNYVQHLASKFPHANDYYLTTLFGFNDFENDIFNGSL